MEVDRKDARSYHVFKYLCAAFFSVDFMKLEYERKFKYAHFIIIWEPENGFILKTTMEGIEMMDDAG